MKAAVWYAKEDIRVEYIDEPVVRPGKVKVKIAWTGICGSDLHAYHGHVVQVNEPHPVSGEMAPLTLGHESSGFIVEVGEGVTGFTAGDRVAIEPMLRCGKCQSCKDGNPNLCDHIGFIGLHGNGTFAEYAIVDPYMLHKLPDHIEMDEAALIEPTAVAFHAVKLSQQKVGDKVAVFGAGPIGLLTIISAKAAGASQIIAVDISSERLALAAKVGATAVIDATKEDAVQSILANTGGVDVAYEAAGAASTVNNALASLRKQGEVVIVSIIPNPIAIDINPLTIKEAKMTATIGYRNVYPQVIDMIASGTMNVKQIITKKIPLDKIVEEGFQTLITDKAQAKILVELQA
ncbi:2,3-butanediol dehydrogenase [Paenibacillus agilis]|uniref:2,3-butanediol dehydrogenase n=1 Tax=Paenibacillus agilis TaxID=3020863 RepID=A0A559IPI2_9BACL|nr:2,3-butanediol dehydrogenase [Paenibacillus agilis]TVX89554.1 2,3-butanediol dehydrogenase [Paenibacillus agilis]